MWHFQAIDLPGLISGVHSNSSTEYTTDLKKHVQLRVSLDAFRQTALLLRKEITPPGFPKLRMSITFLYGLPPGVASSSNLREGSHSPRLDSHLGLGYRNMPPDCIRQPPRLDIRLLKKRLHLKIVSGGTHHKHNNYACRGS